MAKKKVVKKVPGIKGGEGPKIEPVDNALAINQIINEVKRQKTEINLLGAGQRVLAERIDRLVNAISKAKSVKGI